MTTLLAIIAFIMSLPTLAQIALLVVVVVIIMAGATMLAPHTNTSHYSHLSKRG